MHRLQWNIEYMAVESAIGIMCRIESHEQPELWRGRNMQQLELPGNVGMIETASRIRFRGPEKEIIALAGDIGSISRLPPGGLRFCGI